MTLVIGLSSDDGILLASDSQVSLGAMSVPGKKLYASDDGGFIFGMAGDGAVIQHLVEELREAQLSDSPSEVRGTLEKLVSTKLAELRDIAELSLGADLAVDALQPPDIVVATYCSGEPHLFLIDGRSICTDIEEGFVAIGSGAAFADHALLVAFRHLWGPGFGWPHAAMLCGRVVRDSVAASGPSVAIGGEPQYAFVRPDGGMLLEEQKWSNLIRFGIDTWMAREAEAFQTAADTPLPEEIRALFEATPSQADPDEDPPAEPGS